MPTFVADRPGSYELRLIVNDGTVDSAPDTVTIAAVTPLTLSLAPDPLTVTQGLGAAMTLSLSVPAPAGGLTINLSTDNPAIATVPPTVTVPQDQTSAEITVTGVGVGSTTMRASTPGSAEATATVNVVPGPLLSILDQTIGKDLQVGHTRDPGGGGPGGRCPGHDHQRRPDACGALHERHRGRKREHRRDGAGRVSGQPELLRPGGG